MSMVAIFVSQWQVWCARALTRVPLTFLRCPLSRLQRIDRSRASKPTALSWRMLRLGNHQIAAHRPWHAAFDHKQIIVFIDAENAQVAHGDSLIAHVPRHAHAFEDARRECRRADRAGDLEHRTVRLRATAKMMALDYTLKTL